MLGSASLDLLRQSSEGLAGRIFYHEIGCFTLKELGAAKHEKLWFRCSLPRSYLVHFPNESNEWRKGFIRTFLERDLPQLGISINSTTMRRFWTMLAHYHGQVWNSSEFARSFGVADTTIRSYLDRFTSALVVHILQDTGISPESFPQTSNRTVCSSLAYIHRANPKKVLKPLHPCIFQQELQTITSCGSGSSLQCSRIFSKAYYPART